MQPQKPVILSIDESIQRLKAEILAQDWRLSGTRADLLEAAFACLRQRFRNRRAAHDILTMANSVLAYVRRHGDRQHPNIIAFLKEAMAHVVNMHEEPNLDLDRDRQTFQIAYNRFLTLKKTLQKEQRKGAPAQDAPAPPPPPPDAALDPLVRELKSSLKKAEEVGATIRQLLVELLAQRRPGDAAGIDAFVRATILARQGKPATQQAEITPQGVMQPPPHEGSPATVPSAAPPRVEPLTNAAAAPPPVDETPQPCSATDILVFTLGGQQLAVKQRFVTARHTLPASRKPQYLKESMVPLRDFGTLFRPLSRRFTGPLGRLSGGKLKQLSLPILTLRGFHLPDPQDEELTTMLVLSNGHWHGILLCSGKIGEPSTMTRLRRHRDGDIAGTAYTDDGLAVPLLDAAALLQREGNLVLV